MRQILTTILFIAALAVGVLADRKKCRTNLGSTCMIFKYVYVPCHCSPVKGCVFPLTRLSYGSRPRSFE